MHSTWNALFSEQLSLFYDYKMDPHLLHWILSGKFHGYISHCINILEWWFVQCLSSLIFSRKYMKLHITKPMLLLFPDIWHGCHGHSNPWGHMLCHPHRVDHSCGQTVRRGLIPASGTERNQRKESYSFPIRSWGESLSCHSNWNHNGLHAAIKTGWEMQFFSFGNLLTQLKTRDSNAFHEGRIVLLFPPPSLAIETQDSSDQVSSC